ncbi:MAG TPA: hypothetical protein VF893_07675, partial [Candidatus Bathyarchaeia archaeon]
VYTVGKGPSATSVSIQNDVITHGETVMIKGTVMDIAAGTKQDMVAARFPQGVPAVSDESMSAWMEYVYMQQPRPAANGVSVTLTVFDPNGNIYDIGTATSDTTGMYKLLWEPPVPGEYTVIAQFVGSEGYWPSYSQTAIGVLEAPTVEPPPETPPTMTDTYVLAGVVAIIITVIAVGATIVLFTRKRL